ncbi:hypothetical protein [Haloarcula salina]|uniref:Uncharacterized protein n=1 Tax=Haloarcula salina TaxID=1429914 RepID=A0AA41KEV5_9EURY|nr:hypothetical protein [Haloarcula salina]MBV0901362.1 hypothetical protein [Haloarcula salina]
MQSLDPGDLLFVGGFVAVLCFAVAGFVSVAAPSGVPGFTGALVWVFVGFGVAFGALGVLGAALVVVLSE